MLPYLTGRLRQPVGGPRTVPRRPRAVDDARDSIAAAARRRPRRGGLHPRWDRGRQPGRGRGAGRPRTTGQPAAALVCAAMEHHAVLNACRALARRTGAELREVRTWQADGLVDLDRPGRRLHAGGRTGVGDGGQQRDRDGAAPRRGGRAGARAGRPDALFHTDAVQAVPWLDVGHGARHAADLVAISAHKFGGPKGMRRPGGPARRSGLRPLLHGGGQERERRSGTHERGRDRGHGRGPVGDRRRGAPRRWPGWPPCGTDLVDGLVASVAGAVETGGPGTDGGRHRSICGSPGWRPRRWSVLLDQAGVAVVRRGGVLQRGRRGQPRADLDGSRPDEAASGIRFSLGSTTTDAEIDHGPGRRSGCGRASCETDRVRVLVAMSGGVDSSVAAAMLADELGPRPRWWGPRSSCGAAPRTRGAARWPTSTTPAGWPISWDWSTTCSTSPTTSRSGW